MKSKLFIAVLCMVLGLVNMISVVEAAEVSYYENSEDQVQISEEEALEILSADENGISPFALSTTTFKISKKDSKLYVAWTIKSTTTSSTIGISSLKLQKYENGAWITISTASYSTSNASVYTSGFYYSSAVSGTKYRATGTAYTIDSGSKKTMTITTSELTY